MTSKASKPAITVYITPNHRRMNIFFYGAMNQAILKFTFTRLIPLSIIHPRLIVFNMPGNLSLNRRHTAKRFYNPQTSYAIDQFMIGGKKYIPIYYLYNKGIPTIKAVDYRPRNILSVWSQVMEKSVTIS